jgi:hypothetical protein
MTVGAAAATANAWLNVLRGTTYTGIAALYVKLHIGDPGAAGTSNAAAVTTRNQLTLAAASGGVAALSALANYAMTATETISHVSVWDDPTAGNLVCTGALTVPKSVNNGDTLVFNTFAASIAPIAA